jgi:hypothetical protein
MEPFCRRRWSDTRRLIGLRRCFQDHRRTTELDGMHYWLLDTVGLIKEMTILWRPLPAAIAVRDQLGS